MDELAQARIDALQREVTYQLVQLWTLAKGEEPVEVVENRFQGILAIFKEADADVVRRLDDLSKESPTAVTSTDEKHLS